MGVPRRARVPGRLSATAPLRDAVVVGAGPNGLAATLELARRGYDVELLEGADEIGGGCRTEERTLPGYRHDVCSTIMALARRSEVLRSVDLEAHGAQLLAPPVALAHPLEDGRCAVVRGDVRTTSEGLGADAAAYRRLLGPIERDAAALFDLVLSPIRRVPSRPVAAAAFGAVGILPAAVTARRFTTPEARGLLAGVAAHAVRPLHAPLTTAFALVLLGAAHVDGWPVVRGGSARLAEALAAAATEAGATIRTGAWVRGLDELPPSRAVLLDVAPASLASMAGERLRAGTRRALERFARSPGVCKVDWALSGPVPWRAAPCRAAGTVHVGGTFEEVAAAEDAVARGRHPERPFCIVVQASVVDPSRAPAGHQTLWAYCHVPNGSPLDVTDAIEAQLERFAPGFRDLVVARRTTTAAQAASHNPNLLGGDVSGGAATLRQTLFRPLVRWHPYRTGLHGVWLCSASTPPGGGVHGMCGYHAATDAAGHLASSSARSRALP